MSTLSEILEMLRHRAEEFTADVVNTRRPSWAPALVVTDEFVQLAHFLGLMQEGDKPIVRLWAKFADPREKGTFLRQQVGLTLEGVRCRAFDLHTGMTRKGRKLFWAKRGNDTAWEHDSPSWTECGDQQLYNLRSSVRELSCRCAIMKERLEGDRCTPEERQSYPERIEQAQRELAEIEPKYKAAQEALDIRNNKIARLLELARELVIEFGGGDHFTQMTAGWRQPSDYQPALWRERPRRDGGPLHRTCAQAHSAARCHAPAQ